MVVPGGITPTAGLPALGKMVSVGPPLSARVPSEASREVESEMPPVALKPQDPSSSTL